MHSRRSCSIRARKDSHDQGYETDDELDSDVPECGEMKPVFNHTRKLLHDFPSTLMTPWVALVVCPFAIAIALMYASLSKAYPPHSLNFEFWA